MNNFKIFFTECENKMKEICLEDAKSQTELIFCYVLNINKGKLALQEQISKKHQKQVLKIIRKREKSVPLQHILGNVEFLNLKLKVNKNVLIPRNETEQLADLIINDIKNAKKNNLTVLDMCCGSGCLGLSIAKNTKSFVTLSDISKKAIKIAIQNGKQNNVENIEFKLSDLFQAISKKYDVFVSNPPYVKTNDILGLEKQVKHFEPILALDGGQSGLIFYKKIIKDLPSYLNNNASVYFEVGINQAKSVKQMLKSAGFKNIEVVKDYNNQQRIVKATFN